MKIKPTDEFLNISSKVGKKKGQKKTQLKFIFFKSLRILFD